MTPEMALEKTKLDGYQVLDRIRSHWLSTLAHDLSGPLFAVIGFALDNWIQSVAAVLMTASAAWMVIALRRQPA